MTFPLTGAHVFVLAATTRDLVYGTMALGVSRTVDRQCADRFVRHEEVGNGRGTSAPA
jgi:hypothetical protein